jgi:protein ImuB
MLWVALHFSHLPPGAIEPIAAWACQFTPRVALEPPQGLLLEVEGSLRYFGGLEALLHRLRKTELGYAVSLGVATTARAALWFSRGNAKALEEVRLEATGWDLGLFKSIGISTVGELMRLPREGLARRCGQQLLDDLDRALGSAPEAHEFFVPPARFAAKLELPAEVTHAEGLLFAARRLLVQLEGLLAARHAGVRSFTLKLLHRQNFSIIKIGLASPARDAERLAQLLRERLAALPLAAPVEAIALEAADFTPLPGSSADLFGDAAGEAEDWARLLERLRARLGQEAVCALTCYPDHRPEHAWRRVEPGEWEPREFTPPGPRPVWLLEPRKLDEDGLVLLAGPERIECGWWDGDDARRDYFIARLNEFSLAWIYREGGVWYLHGLFA